MSGDNVDNALTPGYPNPYCDFYDTGRPKRCIFKSGPQWPVREEPRAWGIIREPRPVQPHPIQSSWISIATSICDTLDSICVFWTSIDPLAYANAGESKPFCPFIISVGVKPGSLSYPLAVEAASLVKKILIDAGFSDIEVAFVESVVTHSVGSQLLSFDPIMDIADPLPKLRKPFTPTLGLSIASSTYPHHEGTGALFFRLPKDDASDDRIVLLTCAHVARPFVTDANTLAGTTYRRAGQRLEEIVALGTMAFDKAMAAMLSTIDNRLCDIDESNDILRRLGTPTKGESTNVTQKRISHLNAVAKATKELDTEKELHREAAMNFTTLKQRKLGFVLHASKIDEPGPYNFTQDWALIELYKDKIDWETFNGNKVWVGGDLSFYDFRSTMFPHQGRESYPYPSGGFLQATTSVPESEMRDPQHLDVHGEKCLLVIKNGSATGCTVGRMNRLESFTRFYSNSNLNSDSTSDHGPHAQTHTTTLQIAILPYDKSLAHRIFSLSGDSGSIVLDRAGRIVGIITSTRNTKSGTRAGSLSPPDDDEPYMTYITPYWWLEQKIKDEFPGIALYEGGVVG